MSESLHIVAVHVQLFPAGTEMDYERFTEWVLGDLADNVAMWSIGNDAIEGDSTKRTSALDANLASTATDLPRSVTLRQEMARFEFKIVGEHEYWLPFGAFVMIHNENGNEDTFSFDVDRLLTYAKQHISTDHDPFDKYMTFLAVYEFHAIASYSYEGEKDVDYEWYLVGFLDDLSKLRTIVRQHAGDPCAKCEGTGRKRTPSLTHSLIMGKSAIENCEVCNGAGVLP